MQTVTIHLFSRTKGYRDRIGCGIHHLLSRGGCGCTAFAAGWPGEGSDGKGTRPCHRPTRWFK